MITTNRSVVIVNSGDVIASNTYEAAENTASPGYISIVSLASGANTIFPPTGGTTPVGVTISPPTGNTSVITLKGVAGDTGIEIHKTDPTSLGLNSPTNTFVLDAAAIITGVRLNWT